MIRHSLFASVFSVALLATTAVLAQPASNGTAAMAPADVINAVDAMAGTNATAPANNTAPVDPNAPPADPAAAPVSPAPVADVPFTGSFMFTPFDLSEISRAKMGVILPTASTGTGETTAGGVQIPAVRRIILSGVYYRSANDWIVWINGQKLTPGNLLPEIVGIKVSQDRVHLKWFDIGLNGVISITMRPRQIYDIVTGVILPE